MYSVLSMFLSVGISRLKYLISLRLRFVLMRVFVCFKFLFLVMSSQNQMASQIEFASFSSG